MNEFLKSFIHKQKEVMSYVVRIGIGRYSRNVIG